MKWSVTGEGSRYVPDVLRVHDRTTKKKVTNQSFGAKGGKAVSFINENGTLLEFETRKEACEALGVESNNMSHHIKSMGAREDSMGTINGKRYKLVQG